MSALRCFFCRRRAVATAITAAGDLFNLCQHCRLAFYVGQTFSEAAIYEVGDPCAPDLNEKTPYLLGQRLRQWLKDHR